MRWPASVRGTRGWGPPSGSRTTRTLRRGATEPTHLFWRAGPAGTSVVFEDPRSRISGPGVGLPSRELAGAGSITGSARSDPALSDPDPERPWRWPQRPPSPTPNVGFCRAQPRLGRAPRRFRAIHRSQTSLFRSHQDERLRRWCIESALWGTFEDPRALGSPSSRAESGGRAGRRSRRDGPRLRSPAFEPETLEPGP